MPDLSQQVEHHEGIEPSLGQRLINFTTAAIGHFLRGAPTVSEKELLRRGNICRDCEFFNGIHCKKCGCCVDSGKRNFFAKLAWADQHCPVDKW